MIDYDRILGEKKQAIETHYQQERMRNPFFEDGQWLVVCKIKDILFPTGVRLDQRFTSTEQLAYRLFRELFEELGDLWIVAYAMLTQTCEHSSD